MNIKFIKLDTVCSTITDGSHYSPKSVDIGYPMLSVKDMRDYGFDYSNCNHITEVDFEIMKKNGCVPLLNDVLIAKDGSYLKEIFVVAEYREQAILSSIGILRPKIDLVNPYFLKYYLSTEYVKRQVGRKYVSGSALPRIILKNFKDIDIPNVSLVRQNSIVNSLKLIDDKIIINKHINDNLQQLLMESFVQQFECFASCNKQLKFDKVLKKNIPIDWNSIQIKSLASIESGYPFNSDNYSSVGQYKLITIKNVQDSGIDVDTGDRINIVPSDLPDYCKLKSKDILLSLTGNVGRVGLMFTDNCLLNQRVANITPLDESLRPYLFCLFKSQTLRITMERISGGTSQKNLSPIETGNLYIPFNYDIAKQFSIKTDPIISKYVECLKENLKLTQLRNELLPLLMNGQVSIT